VRGSSKPNPSGLLAHYINVVSQSYQRERWFCGGSVAVFAVVLGGLYVTTTALMRLPMIERLLASAGFWMLMWLDDWGWWAGGFVSLPGAAVPTGAHLSLLGEGGKVVAE
jgi:hypothetical protein